MGCVYEFCICIVLHLALFLEHGDLHVHINLMGHLHSLPYLLQSVNMH